LGEVGTAFEELTFEEMTMSQGTGEVQARTSAACVASIVPSRGWCGTGLAIGSLIGYSVKIVLDK